VRRRVSWSQGGVARLSEAGLTDPGLLLETATPAAALPGSWECLSKPGLGGRERWRWSPAGADAVVYYVKRYRRTPLREQLDRALRQTPRHSRAWWEFRQSEELTRQFVPVVRALAVAEETSGPLERRSAVVFEGLAGDAFDRVWLRLVAVDAPVTRGLARHDLIRRLARFVSAFHQTGYCHRDLYLCHVFSDLDPDGGRPPRFTLIDLARTHRPRLRRTRWLIKDLAQLDSSARQIGASRGDRLRFLKAYLSLEAHSPRLRWYARRIVRKSDTILHRLARHAARGGGSR